MFDRFKRFKAIVEHETKSSIKTFRTDIGGKFTSREFNQFCKSSGIKRHLTAPYNPQQNGVVEKKESNVVRDDRSILKHMEVPNYLWGEAVRHSTYLIIRVGTKTLASQTPYEAYKGRKLSLEHLRIFGSIGYTKTEAPNLKKLDDRSRSLVPLGT